MENFFGKLKEWFKTEVATPQKDEEDSSFYDNAIKRRVVNIMLTDRISDEIRKMVVSGSGCGFIALLRVILHLNSDIVSNRKKQIEFIESFQKEFRSLDAELGPDDLVRFCEQNNLGVKIIALHYSVDLGSSQEIWDAISSKGKIKVDFPVREFDPDQFSLTLEANQVAILGLEKRTNQGIVAHYLCSDPNEILSKINPGGDLDLGKYLSKGYKFSDVVVFEKKQ